MQIAVVKERENGETRVAAIPETVKKFKDMGFEVTVESGAGAKASYMDDDYVAAGAKMGKSTALTVKDADIILKIQPPQNAEIASYPAKSRLVCLMAPHDGGEMLAALAQHNITGFGLDLLPRITRAQGMDVLSSQSSLAGYQAVIEAAAVFGRAFPLMMTAAGTIPPARVFIMGAGVAGLQAVATAKRLGAVVSATDVRDVAREQVESLGGKFVTVDTAGHDTETMGGYAREMSKDYQKKQKDLIAETISKQDIVITTALIPGKTAPELITADMIKSMKPGSVIVDLAASRGGNCALTQPDKVIEQNGVTIIGYSNMPARIGVDASALFARNLYNFVRLLLTEDGQSIKSDYDDEILKASLLTDGGKIVHPEFKKRDTKPAPKTRSPAKPKAKKAAPKKGGGTVKGSKAKRAAPKKTAAVKKSPPKTKKD